MPYTKITEQDLVNKGVTGLPDTPNLSTSEMQQKVDELAKEVIVPKFNNLVDELDNSNIGKKVESETITNMKLNEDNNIEVSTDGGTTYKQTSSSGHIIMDGTGRSFPQRSRLQYSANVQITDIQSDNTTFLTVPSGVKGDKGDSATIQIGNVASSPIPYVTNVGSQYDAIFDFGIPQGQDGQAATIQVGTVTSGNNASVSNRGTSASAIFDFVLPKGEKGDSGTSFQVLGMYSTYADLIAAHPTGNRGDAYAVGNSTTNVVYNWNNDTQTWDNLGALKGAKGDDGQAATVTVGTVTTGQTSSVINSGTTENAILDFTLEKGDKGDKGDAATIAVGTVTRGENATVTNVGTTTNAVFDFTIPKGDKGDPGEPSIVNGKSGESIVLYGYDMFLKNYTKASQYSDITDDDSIQSAIGKLESRNSGGSKIIVTTDEESIGNTFTLSNGVKTLSQIATSSLVMEFFVDDIGTWTVTNVEAENSTTVTIEYYSVYNVVLGVGNIGITVNYDAEYVGHTFTITNGTKTQTKTATSSLSVSFVCADLGTWVVSNSYDSVTKSINVTEEGQYSVTFTISHGMDIQEWLSKGGVSGTYATLGDILADEKAIRQLMTKHDSVDYLVANASDTENITTILNNDISAKWINLRDYALDTLYATFSTIMDSADKYFYGEWVKNDDETWGAKGNVPIMTSTSSPYGNTFSDSDTSSTSASWYAFDQRLTELWLSGASRSTSASNIYVGYSFTNPICVRKAKVNIDSVTISSTTYKIQGSNDGTTWEDCSEEITHTASNNPNYVSCDNDKYYLKYRLFIISQTLPSTNYVGRVMELQFYGRELSVSVPKMESNNSPWGEVNQSSNVYSDCYGWKAFDNDANTMWGTNDNATGVSDGWVSYSFETPIVCKCVYILERNHQIKKAKVLASNDGNTWTPIIDTFELSTSKTNFITVSGNTPYKMYKLQGVEPVSANTGAYVSTINFYGLDYSEHTERHYIYDNGVEVETVEANGIESQNTGEVTKLNYQIEIRGVSGKSATINNDSEIDLTPYSLVRFKRGSYCYTTDDARAIQLVVSSTKSYTGKISVINIPIGANDFYLDISSIKASSYIFMQCSNDRNDSVKSWWLE